MEIYINHTQVSPETVTFSELGFGTPGSGAKLAYELRIPVGEFVERFEPVYETVIVELRRDDAITGEFDPPYENATEYPSLTHFMEVDGAAFQAFICTFLKFDIFEQYFPASQGDSARVSLATVDDISVSRDYVTLRGCARPLPGAHEYTDHPCR
jgi:hypothetical protein